MSGDWRRVHIIFVMLTAPLIFNLSPNSKQGKWQVDHCEFFYVLKINIALIYNFWDYI